MRRYFFLCVVVCVITLFFPLNAQRGMPEFSTAPVKVIRDYPAPPNPELARQTCLHALTLDNRLGHDLFEAKANPNFLAANSPKRLSEMIKAKKKTQKQIEQNCK